ncbi:MAG: cytochrome c oxidase subunit II [Rhodothermales bacterium]|nr:cytochrome c oxidase subunit II [Rhodothermales bacterium]
MKRIAHVVLLGGCAVAATATLAGCGGPQSALDPAGRGAEQIATLFWWLVAGSAVVWVAVIGMAVYAIRLRPRPHAPRTVKLLIIGGGVAFPTVVLAGYLIYGLALLPPLLAPAPPGALRIEISGEMWWWRVRYLPPGGPAVELANEIRLPVGRPVELRLTSPDVIHSFWIPALGGKMDMIPGRTTRLRLEPTRTGTFRGVCAEFCGPSHALMRFFAVVEEEDAFAEWLAHQARPAARPTAPLALRGQAVFRANGCGACHAVRGTDAAGVIGPDLTHVGSRLSLGAGVLPTAPDAFRQWIGHTDAVKPGVHMPAYGMLDDADLRALAAYLDGLR